MLIRLLKHPTVKILFSLLKYFLSACMGLGADWLTWLLVIKLTGNPYVAQGIGRGVGAIVAFYLFKNHVFQDSEANKTQTIRFISVAGVSWLISLSITSFGLLFFMPVVAKIISDGLTFIMNWFAMRFWVFKRKS
jgi:putative flippase GtrA